MHLERTTSLLMECESQKIEIEKGKLRRVVVLSFLISGG